MEIIPYRDYVPGLMSRIIEMQAKYYYKFYNFGLGYEIHLANQLADFLEHYNPQKDVLLYAQSELQIIGSITIKGDREHPEQAQLIWYIMDEDFIGYGVGGKLIQKALEFCMQNQFNKVSLWTFKGLNLAENLYLKNGFILQKERENHEWGKVLVEQYYEKIL
jgi:RimJ/RimL family protein N-acetyltransferase